jgi:predicted HNH restriction endonuclease
VTDQPWFRDLLAEQANFSLGLNRIRSGSVLRALDAIFQEHTTPLSPETLPEEIPEGSYREGQGVQITVNRYERDASARAACLNHFGSFCQICRVDLSTIYGPIAAGLVHVHHLRPLSQVAGEYEVRPDQDLIPVCPNCHAVVHRHDPPLTPVEVREMISQIGGGKA